jgi:hypothetical protein
MHANTHKSQDAAKKCKIGSVNVSDKDDVMQVLLLLIQAQAFPRLKVLLRFKAYLIRKIAMVVCILGIVSTAGLSFAAESPTPLALPSSTKEKLVKMDFLDFASDWSFFWSSQPLEAELNKSLHAVVELDGDAYLSEAVINDLTAGFRSFCAAHNGKVNYAGNNFYPRRLTGISCQATQSRFNGYMKYQIKRAGDFMYADVWFVPESEYIDSEELASQEQSNHYHYIWRMPNRPVKRFQ